MTVSRLELERQDVPFTKVSKGDANLSSHHSDFLKISFIAFLHRAAAMTPLFYRTKL